MTGDAAIRARILELVAERGPGKTFCPSEVARALGADWRALMPEVRRVAGILVREGLVEATQRGERVDPETARGAIRLGRP